MGGTIARDPDGGNGADGALRNRTVRILSFSPTPLLKLAAFGLTRISHAGS